MADTTTLPDICGWRKKDLNGKFAQLVAVVENLKKTDKVNVDFPDDRSSSYLTITINSFTKKKYIPRDIIKEECSYKVKCKPGKDSEIIIKLRKSSAVTWTRDRWSPSRDEAPALGAPGERPMEITGGESEQPTPPTADRSHTGEQKQKKARPAASENHQESDSSQSDSDSSSDQLSD